MHHLYRVEFYITNVCNLNCPNCNRFNNFAFTGHQYWDDHKDAYTKWANILSVKEIGILGGEPLLNPEFPKWLAGVAELWPNAEIGIVSNGTQLDRWENLYELVAQHQGRVNLDISGHNQHQRDEDLTRYESWLQAPVVREVIKSMDWNNAVWQKCYNDIRDPSWPDCSSPEEFDQLPDYVQQECRTLHRVCPEVWESEIYGVKMTDANGIVLKYTPSWVFNTTTVLHNAQTGHLQLHRSDPAKAMDICYFKKCHHFIGGRLYKCGPVGILPDFIKQFKVDITSSEQELINSYQPAEPDWTNDELEQFVGDLQNAVPIKQCTFCPEQFVPLRFTASNKKIKVIKLHH